MAKDIRARVTELLEVAFPEGRLADFVHKEPALMEIVGELPHETHAAARHVVRRLQEEGRLQQLAGALKAGIASPPAGIAEAFKVDPWFTDREAELADLCAYLTAPGLDDRILFVLGQSGMGKTRLANEAIARCREYFQDELPVDCADRSLEELLVLQADALGIKTLAGPRPSEPALLESWLAEREQDAIRVVRGLGAERRLIILLDGLYDHLGAPRSEQIRELRLLRQHLGSNACVLITSRADLVKQGISFTLPVFAERDAYGVTMLRAIAPEAVGADETVQALAEACGRHPGTLEMMGALRLVTDPRGRWDEYLRELRRLELLAFIAEWRDTAKRTSRIRYPRFIDEALKGVLGAEEPHALLLLGVMALLGSRELRRRWVTAAMSRVRAAGGVPETWSVQDDRQIIDRALNRAQLQVESVGFEAPEEQRLRWFLLLWPLVDDTVRMREDRRLLVDCVARVGVEEAVRLKVGKSGARHNDRVADARMLLELAQNLGRHGDRVGEARVVCELTPRLAELLGVERKVKALRALMDDSERPHLQPEADAVWGRRLRAAIHHNYALALSDRAYARWAGEGPDPAWIEDARRHMRLALEEDERLLADATTDAAKAAGQDDHALHLREAAVMAWHAHRQAGEEGLLQEAFGYIERAIQLAGVAAARDPARRTSLARTELFRVRLLQSEAEARPAPGRAGGLRQALAELDRLQQLHLQADPRFEASRTMATLLDRRGMLMEALGEGAAAQQDWRRALDILGSRPASGPSDESDDNLTRFIQRRLRRSMEGTR
ncbi:MAG: hypothetical protein H6739_14075 [Alphaproteobacteria bacterium]|nr:hypothetical protein [Alphaproteobacteria bacterium]